MYFALAIIFVILLIIFIGLKKRQPTEKLNFIDLNKYNGKLFNDLAIDSIKFGDNKKAIYYFTKSIELKPELYEYYLNRGNLYWDIGTTSLAIIDWKSAKKLGSTIANELLVKNTPIHQEKVCKVDKFEATLNDFGVQYVYHMTHKSNLENILQNGLLSHNKAYLTGVTKTDISDRKVNRRRSKVHDYVPFYFNPKNPMLYKRKNIQSEIIILCADRNLLKENFQFTDGNAASNSTKFFNEIKDFEKLNWSIINSDYWSDFIDGKRIRCSEILIPDKVKTANIMKIICNNSETKKFVIDKIENRKIKVEINTDYYF